MLYIVKMLPSWAVGQTANNLHLSMEGYVCVRAHARARVYVCVGGDGVGRLGTEGYPAQAELRNGA